MKNIYKLFIYIIAFTVMTPSVEAYSYRYNGASQYYQNYNYGYPSSYVPNIITRPSYTYSYVPYTFTRLNYDSSYAAFTNSRVVYSGSYVPGYYR